MRNTWDEKVRKVTRGGSENFVFTENFQIDNVPVVFNTVDTVLRKYLIKRTVYSNCVENSKDFFSRLIVEF